MNHKYILEYFNKTIWIEVVLKFDTHHNAVQHAKSYLAFAPSFRISKLTKITEWDNSEVKEN